jgi:hypothetical protein
MKFFCAFISSSVVVWSLPRLELNAIYVCVGLHTTTTMNLASPPLSNFTPPLSESLVTNLSALNIRTAPDFIFVPPAELLRKLPTGSITFPELTRHIAHVKNAFAGPALTGDQLIGEAEARAQLSSVFSGLPALDGLVGNSFGGASGGRVVEISGASASGKTVRTTPISLHDVNCNYKLTLLCLW